MYLYAPGDFLSENKALDCCCIGLWQACNQVIETGLGFVQYRKQHVNAWHTLPFFESANPPWPKNQPFLKLTFRQTRLFPDGANIS